MILAPDRNIWRLERAERAAVLIDAARYFGALRETLITARSSVFVIGWDLDSRTRLVGESGRPTDHYPETFVHFLTALVHERPQLLVHLLVWDYSDALCARARTLSDGLARLAHAATHSLLPR